MIVKTEDEIEEMRDRAAEMCMKPEYSNREDLQGVRDALAWVLGDAEDDELL